MKINQNTPLLLPEYYGIMCFRKTEGKALRKAKKRKAKR